MGSFVDRMEEEYKEGMVVFKQLFELKCPDIKEKLKSICEGHISENTLSDILADNSNVYKSTTNDEPSELKVCSWDSIIVNAFGVSYKPEHGNAKQIVKFNKHFKI